MDSGIARIQKQFDNVNARNTKLQEENAKLKKQLAEHKTNNSRIRRVPQKKDKAGDKVEKPAETTKADPPVEAPVEVAAS